MRLHPMPNRASLSIAGLYSWDEHIFDLLQLPAGVNRTTIIDNILLECAELTVIYPDWNFMRRAIGSWSTKELPIWDKVYNLEHLEYNPIENYDRYEDEVENTAEKGAGTRQQSANNSRVNAETRTEANETESEGRTLNLNQHINMNADTANGNTINKVAGYNTSGTDTQSEQNTTNANMAKGNDQTSALSDGNATETGSTTGNTVANESGKNFNTDINTTARENTRSRGSRIHGNIGVTTTQQMMTQELDILPRIHVDDYIINSFKERFCILVY